jgi:hypothetical protein
MTEQFDFSAHPKMVRQKKKFNNQPAAPVAPPPMTEEE